MPVRAEGLVICIGLASRIELHHLRFRSRIESRFNSRLGGTGDLLADQTQGLLSSRQREERYPGLGKRLGLRPVATTTFGNAAIDIDFQL